MRTSIEAGDYIRRTNDKIYRVVEKDGSVTPIYLEGIGWTNDVDIKEVFRKGEKCIVSVEGPKESGILSRSTFLFYDSSLKNPFIFNNPTSKVQSWRCAWEVKPVPMELTFKMNGELVHPSKVSKETWMNFKEIKEGLNFIKGDE